jgi:hypothetical protein
MPLNMLLIKLVLRVLNQNHGVVLGLHDGARTTGEALQHVGGAAGHPCLSKYCDVLRDVVGQAGCRHAVGHVTR